MITPLSASKSPRLRAGAHCDMTRSVTGKEVVIAIRGIRERAGVERQRNP
jgi:hypothetical protein